MDVREASEVCQEFRATQGSDLMSIVSTFDY